MTQIKCLDYGFECKYEIDVESSNLLEKFGKHMEQMHGIEYQKESLMVLISNKINVK